MEAGRAVEKLIERGVKALERNAVASEELISLAKEERTVEASMISPGYCPHCATVNPTVRSEGGAGHIDEYVLVANCENCHGTFYAIPQGWHIVGTPEEAREIMEARNERSS